MNEKQYLEWKVRRDYNDIDDGWVGKFRWKTQLDSSNRWRIYVSWNEKDDIIMPFHLPESYDEYDMMTNDSSFGFDEFPLPLWNYGSYDGICKIGLDEFPYSELTDEDTKYNKDDPIVSHEKIEEMAKEIINCITKYQLKKAKIIQYNKEMEEIDAQKNKVRQKWEQI
jgi:hypothetical protein